MERAKNISTYHQELSCYCMTPSPKGTEIWTWEKDFNPHSSLKMVNWQIIWTFLFVCACLCLALFFSSSIHVTNDKVHCSCPYIDLCSVWSGWGQDDGAHARTQLSSEIFRYPWKCHQGSAFDPVISQLVFCKCIIAWLLKYSGNHTISGMNYLLALRYWFCFSKFEPSHTSPRDWLMSAWQPPVSREK